MTTSLPIRNDFCERPRVLGGGLANNFHLINEYCFKRGEVRVPAGILSAEYLCIPGGLTLNCHQAKYG